MEHRSFDLCGVASGEELFLVCAKTECEVPLHHPSCLLCSVYLLLTAQMREHYLDHSTCTTAARIYQMCAVNKNDKSQEYILFLRTLILYLELGEGWK